MHSGGWGASNCFGPERFIQGVGLCNCSYACCCAVPWCIHTPLAHARWPCMRSCAHKALLRGVTCTTGCPTEHDPAGSSSMHAILSWPILHTGLANAGLPAPPPTGIAGLLMIQCSGAWPGSAQAPYANLCWTTAVESRSKACRCGLASLIDSCVSHIDSCVACSCKQALAHDVAAPVGLLLCTAWVLQLAVC